MKPGALLILIFPRLAAWAIRRRRRAGALHSGGAWLNGIRPAPFGNYDLNTRAGRRLMARLRCEARWQRPQEGRN